MLNSSEHLNGFFFTSPICDFAVRLLELLANEK